MTFISYVVGCTALVLGGVSLHKGTHTNTLGIVVFGVAEVIFGMCMIVQAISSYAQ